MHSVSKFIDDESQIEENATTKNIWKKSSLNLQINQNKNERDNYFKCLKNVFKTPDTAVFYSDAAHNAKTKTSSAHCVLYQNTNTALKT
jgi:hypothetical protein